MRRFKLRDIAPLLVGTECGFDDDDVKTALVRAELIDDGADVCGENMFRLVFMDPRDDLFYVARFDYDKVEGGLVFWCGLRRAGDNEILQMTGFWDLDEGAQLECTVDCTRVERREITRTEWVEAT